MPLAGSHGCVVVGIDGVPLSTLRHVASLTQLPTVSSLLRETGELRSVYPTVSAAAWTSFMTGLHPPRHGVMGFVNKDHGYRISFPTRDHIRAALLQERVSREGGRVFSMGVPVTYPPMPLNGVVISCFLAPSLEKAVWPAREVATLADLGYVIDADPLVAHQDRRAFMGLVKRALKARIATVHHYFARESWDLFLVHVMETDRLHHFFWDDLTSPDSPFHADALECYRMVDELLGWFLDRLGSAERLVVLSDHGFCRLKWEVNAARWLVDQGMTALASAEPGPPLSQINWGETRVYSMIPGRLWVNTKGREPQGIVEASRASQILDEVRRMALEWRDPDGLPVLEEVFVRDRIPGYVDHPSVPDALMVPARGMDLKDGILRPAVFERKVLVGMHTFDDALLFLGGRPVPPGAWIGDLAPTLCALMGIPIPEHLDGQPLQQR